MVPHSKSFRVLPSLFVLLAATPLVAQTRQSVTGPDVDSHPWTGKTRPPQFTPPSPPDGSDQEVAPGRRDIQNETAIAVNPLDPLNAVGVANDFRSGNVLTGFYTTLDGGLTWKRGALPLEPSFSFSGDPSVIFTPGGIPVIICLQYFGTGGSGVWAYQSLDGGITWQPGVEIDRNDANDKVQSACDLSNGPHHGQICAAWDRFGTASGDTISTSVSDDGGLTWSRQKRIDDRNGNGIAPDVAYGANSELWVVWADRGTFEVLVDRSTDGGATFGTDIKVSDFKQVPSPIPGSSFRMFDIFTIAADWTGGPHSGTVYVVWHNWKAAAPKNADIKCAASPDHGVTWNTVVVNASDTTDADQVMPHAAVDSKGNVNVGFYDRRLDANNFLLWYWVARSSDGGATFREYRASDLGWDHNATENPGFIGDYTGIDVSDHFVRPLWTDGRTGSQDLVSDVLFLDFFTDVSTLSAATGGTVNFTINIGPNFAGQDYWVLGSLATTPGLTFGNGVHLPLNFDALFLLTMQFANSPALPGTRGLLDGTGSAAAGLVAGPFNAAFAGTDLFFATLLLDPSPSFATNETKVTLVP